MVQTSISIRATTISLFMFSVGFLASSTNAVAQDSATAPDKGSQVTARPLPEFPAGDLRLVTAGAKYRMDARSPKLPVTGHSKGATKPARPKVGTTKPAKAKPTKAKKPIPPTSGPAYWKAQLQSLDRLIARAKPGVDSIAVGDMLLWVPLIRQQRADLVELMKGRKKGAPRKSAVLWPKGRIPYAFADSVKDADKETFRASCDDWERAANVHFYPRTDEPKYILVHAHDSLNNSFVGQINPGEGKGQPINLYNWTRHTIAHELGHALGLQHEHQRSDRDAYISITTDSPSRQLPSWALVIPDDQMERKTPYDYASLMHYQDGSYDENGNTVKIDVLSEKYKGKVGTFDSPSELDRQTMVGLYGQPLTQEIVCEAIPTVANEALTKRISNSLRVRSFAMAPDGSWVLVEGRNGYQNWLTSAYDDLREELKKANAAGAEIKGVTFEGDKGWILLTGRNTVLSRGINAELAEKIAERVKDNRDFTSISTGAPGHWMLCAGSTYGYAVGPVVDAINKLQEEAGTSLRQVALDAAGGAVIIDSKNAVTTVQAPPALEEHLRDLSKRGRTLQFVSFTPNRGWVLVSTKH